MFLRPQLIAAHCALPPEAGSSSRSAASRRQRFIRHRYGAQPICVPTPICTARSVTPTSAATSRTVSGAWACVRIISSNRAAREAVPPDLRPPRSAHRATSRQSNRLASNSAYDVTANTLSPIFSQSIILWKMEEALRARTSPATLRISMMTSSLDLKTPAHPIMSTTDHLF